jgi:N-acetylmuramoyl-L-alanine amidase
MNKNIWMRIFIVALALLFMAGGAAEAAVFGSRTILIGMRGQDVLELQEFLNENGYREGHVEGVFGPLTLAALIRFQEEHDLAADGVADTETLAVIEELQEEQKEETVMAAEVNEFDFSAADMDLFARIVHAEAEGETFQGQIAVAATILNRIRSEIYPNTMGGVVYQVVSGKYQYSPVLDGRINRPAGESAKRAILEALGGNDPTGGATGFFNPAKTSNAWVRARPVTGVIGSHIFFR